MPRLHELIHAADYALAGRVEFQGLRICIENKKGQIRKGVGDNGKPWAVKMPFDYGYIGNTKGNDGEHVDCYIGPNKSSEYAFVVHQSKETDKSIWDEDKVMLGFDTADAAIKAYKSAYVGVDLFQSMTVLPMDAFKIALRSKKIKLSAGGPGSGRHKTFYHGTYPYYVKGILKNGLIPQKGMSNPSDNPRLDKGKVFVGSSIKTAKQYASQDQSGGTGQAIVKIQVPAEHVSKFKNIVKDSAGDGQYYKGSIPKEWIADVYYKRTAEDKWSSLKQQGKLESLKANYGMGVGEDYHQFREGVAMQPQTSNHPPSLKNPMKVPVDNPDDPEDKYGDRRKRRSKNTKKVSKDLARRQSGKPEIVNTTQFVPFNMG